MNEPKKNTMTTKQIGTATVLIGVLLSPILALAQTADSASTTPNGAGSTSWQQRHADLLAKQAAKKAAREAMNEANLQCVQAATDKREDAIASDWSTYETAISAALSARKSALHDAWGITDTKTRIAARNTAWNTYRTAAKSASSALRSARLSDWSAFASASKACKVPVVEKSANDGI